MAGFSTWGAMPLKAATPEEQFFAGLKAQAVPAMQPQFPAAAPAVAPPPPVPGHARAPKASKDYNALSPDTAATLAAIEAANAGVLKGQEDANAALKARLEAAAARDLPVDLTPMAALVDQWSGSNFSQSYQPGETAASRRDELSKLQDALAKGQQGVGATHLEALKNKLQTRFGIEAQGFNREQADIGNQFKAQELDLRNEELNIKRAEAQKAAAGKGSDKLTSEYVKDYADYVAGGGHAAAEKNLEQLASATARLRASPNATGVMYGMTPDWLKSKTNPNALVIQQDVQNVVMGSLRQLLGSAFTAEEGKRVLNSTYDPSLPPEENAERLERLQTQMALAFEQKRRAAEHFETYKTLDGFKGHLPSVEAVLTESGLGDAKKTSPAGLQDTTKMTLEQKKAYLETLKKQAGG